MKNLLANDPDDEEVVDVLGTSIAALYSVPTAVYCFLRAQNEIPTIKVRYFVLRKVVTLSYGFIF